MKKLSIYLATAAVTMTAISAAPATAYAAVNVCNIPGRKMMVVKGSAGNIDCDQILSALQGICQGDGNFSGSNFPEINVPDNNFPGDTTPDEPGTDVAQDSFAQQVVKLVNEERAKAGLAPLTVDTKAASAAQVRAQEISKSFSHTRPNGSAFSTALTEAGASFKGAGENIAYGQTTPEKVMESWMNSSGHRANILNGSYRAIGVGHYENASGVDYWTQLFIQ